MITVREYLELCDKPCPLSKDDSDKLLEYNNWLMTEYPFLIPRKRWDDEIIDNTYSDGRTYTELDGLPIGWRIAFGNDICEELKAELIKFNYLDKYRIVQIKEKFGTLRWYDGGYPVGKLSDVDKIIYQDIYTYPEKEHEDDFWIYNGKENNKYVFKHCKILDKCRIPDIVKKYENLSETICIECGKPAKWITKGWINFICDDCAEEQLKKYNQKNTKKHYTKNELFGKIYTERT